VTPERTGTQVLAASILCFIAHRTAGLLCDPVGNPLMWTVPIVEVLVSVECVLRPPQSRPNAPSFLEKTLLAPFFVKHGAFHAT
jgi:hypothetical protein